MSELKFENVPFDGEVVAAMQNPADPRMFVTLTRMDDECGKFVIHRCNVLIWDYAHGQYFTLGTPDENRRDAYQGFIETAGKMVKAVFQPFEVAQ
jgi:hypothetical protein